MLNKNNQERMISTRIDKIVVLILSALVHKQWRGEWSLYFAESKKYDLLNYIRL